jgi:REP element-mobilizing transposase RayT
MARKPETIAFWRGRLPHWEVEDRRYFVTIHLAGAIPLHGQERIQSIASELEKLQRFNHERRLQIQRHIFAEMESWLDRASQVDHLRRVEIAEIVIEAIQFRENTQWHMFEYVVMPSHLHLFFEVADVARVRESGTGRLKGILEQFKRWTGHQAAKLISVDGNRFWQDEWFDHWSRSDEEDERIIAYIRRNPEKAGLVKDYTEWPYGCWNKPK